MAGLAFNDNSSTKKKIQKIFKLVVFKVPLKIIFVHLLIRAQMSCNSGETYFQFELLCFMWNLGKSCFGA